MTNPTADNAAVLLLDLQTEIVKNSKTIPLPRLTRAAGILAKLTALHRLPAFASAVPPGGEFLPDVLAPLEGVAPRPRTQTTAFADAGLVEALRATNRRVLMLSGVASEIVVQRTALDALAAGFAVHVLVDACGGIDARTETAAWQRVVAAGGVTSSVVTFAAELAGDFTSAKGGQTLGLMYEVMGD